MYIHIYIFKMALFHLYWNNEINTFVVWTPKFVCLFVCCLFLWIQKSSHLVNASNPGPFSYLRLGLQVFCHPEYQWLAIKGSEKTVTRTPLGGKGWCVWAILYHLCVRAKKKHYNPLIGATMVGNFACPIRGTYSIWWRVSLNLNGL